MVPQETSTDVLEDTLDRMRAWQTAFQNNKLGQIDTDMYDYFVNDVNPLQKIGIDVSTWINIPSRVVSANVGGHFNYDYAILSLKVDSLTNFLERQIERQRQRPATGGRPLADSQIRLLGDLVMANRNVAAGQRQEIVGLSADGATTFFHPGLPDRSLSPDMPDLAILTQRGLIDARDRGGRKGWVIDILSAGEAAIDAIAPRLGQERPPDSLGVPSLPQDYTYHVAISYAGPDIQHADDLAALLERDSYKVFFDKLKKSETWGKDLPSYLQDIYSEKSLFCVLFVSQDYRDRVWTNVELQDALSRQIRQRGEEYILPIKLEDVDLPGLSTSIAYISISDHSIDEIRNMLVDKIRTRLAP